MDTFKHISTKLINSSMSLHQNCIYIFVTVNHGIIVIIINMYFTFHGDPKVCIIKTIPDYYIVL